MAGISATLGELPPEVAGDITIEESSSPVVARCLVVWTSTYVEETKLPVRIADEPRYAIVRGLEQMFDAPPPAASSWTSDAQEFLTYKARQSDLCFCV